MVLSARSDANILPEVGFLPSLQQQWIKLSTIRNLTRSSIMSLAVVIVATYLFRCCAVFPAPVITRLRHLRRSDSSVSLRLDDKINPASAWGHRRKG